MRDERQRRRGARRLASLVTYRHVCLAKVNMTRPHPVLRRTKAAEAGFTLVEVLVSVVILAFGLLGMVGLQAASLQANRDARLQAIGIDLAKELAEMLRGNKNQANLSTANPYLGDFTTPLTAAAPSYCLAVGNSCASEGDIAKAELTDWLSRVDAQLPGAHVVICRDNSPYDANGLPQWDCNSSSETDSIVVKIGWTRTTTRKAVAASDSAFDQATRPSVILPVTAGSTA